MCNREERPGSLLRQPTAVWAVAFACVVAFMGLGLVDPILPAIAGLLLIVVFSAMAGSSNGIGQIVGFRAGWGLGNALFIATALAVIVGVSTSGTEGAVIFYEAALGLGISTGPLIGGELGSISWRGPFYGVAVLMSVAFIAVLAMLRGVPKAKHRSSIADPIRALGHGGLRTMGLMALCYNFGFFTLLAYTPFVLRLDARGLGFVFFGWGVLLAICSVFVAPRIQARFGTVRTIFAMLVALALVLLTIALFTSVQALVIAAVILAGAFLGINNTLVTTVVMVVAPVERPVASAGYSFVRFVGGAVAPWLAGQLSEWFNPHVPYYVGTVALCAAMLVLASGRRYLSAIR